MVLFISLLVCISITITAASITTFTDGKVHCNVTSNDSTSCSINLSEYSSISSATMNVSGNSTSNTTVYNNPVASDIYGLSNTTGLENDSNPIGLIYGNDIYDDGDNIFCTALGKTLVSSSITSYSSATWVYSTPVAQWQSKSGWANQSKYTSITCKESPNVIEPSISVGGNEIWYGQGTSFDYTGTHYDTAGDAVTVPKGCIANTTHLLVINGDKVKKYAIDGTYIGDYFTNYNNVAVEDMTTNGTHVWQVDNSPNYVYEYLFDGTYISNFSVDVETNDAVGIAYADGYLYVGCSGTDEVYKYYLNGTYTGTHFDTATSGNADPHGMETDGTYLWIGDRIDDKVYKYDMTGNLKATYSVTADAANVEGGVCKNDYNFYTTDWVDDEVYKFSMGAYNSTETTSDFSSYLTAGQVNYFNITASSWGMLTLDDLNINASSNTAPNITNLNLTVLDLLNGNQRYNISYDVADGDGDNLTCYVETQSENVSLTWDSGTGACSGEINISQNSTNSFLPKVSDNKTTVNSSVQTGIEIEFDRYLADSAQESTLSVQYFLNQYNLTNNIGSNFSNIQWSLNATDTIKTVNLSTGLNQNSETAYSGDFINEDTGYTFSGSTFLASQAYSVTRYLVYNNTLSVDLPGIELTIALQSYNDTFLAEKQNGILWPDLSSLNNATHARFNISYTNGSQEQQYRYSYNAIFISWAGEQSSNYRLSGQYKEWTLDRVYSVNFNLTGKTVQDTVNASNLGEWVGKTATWTSTLVRNSTSSDYTHTTTDNINSVEFEFDPPLDKYTYQILYYTLVTGGGGGSGGGGGAPPSYDVPDTENGLPTKYGKVVFSQALLTMPVFHTPSSYYKEMLITANGTVAGVVEFTDNLAEHFKADVCDIGSADCSSKVVMIDGETKLLRIAGEIPTDFAPILIKDELIEGQLKIRTPTTESSLPIVIDKVPLYEATHELTKIANENLGLSVSEQFMAGTIYILLLVVCIGFLWFVVQSVA